VTNVIIFAVWSLFVGWVAALWGFRRGYRYSHQELQLKAALEKSAEFRPLNEQEKKFLASFADKSVRL